jgi:DNA-binding GntR family transcriptional regulator
MTLRAKIRQAIPRAPRRAPRNDNGAELAEVVSPRVRLRTPTLASIVQQKIVNDIAHGVLPPGLRLEEEYLARHYHVSRTPVREALRHLAATGLVQKRPHRGVVVTSITRSQLEQMFEAMAELEAVAARLAALRMTAAECRALRQMHEQSADLVRRSDHRAYEAFNRQFHAKLYDGSHNEEIVGLARTMRRRVAPFRRAQFLVPGRLAASFSEHAQVLEHVLAGEAEAAAVAMRAHLQLVGGASALLLDGLEAGGGAMPEMDAVQGVD